MADIKYINQVLTDDEELIHQFGYHWTHYLKFEYFFGHLLTMLIGLGLGFLLVYLFPNLLLVGVLTGLMSWAILEWWFWSYITTDVRIITNKRVILKTGYFNRKTQELKLSAIEAIEFEQTFLERILGVGCLEISGRGGGTEIIFHHVPKPLSTKRLIENVDWEENFDANRSG